MSLLKPLHEEYYTTDDNGLVLFRCSECGYTSMSLGLLHSHVEGHRGYTRFNIQVPFTKTSMANFDQLMEYTEVLQVDETTEVSLAEVEGL